jgi:hypothetical protein
MEAGTLVPVDPLKATMKLILNGDKKVNIKKKEEEED